MDEDEQLRDLMLAVDLPPTGADIGLAKATGRQRARRRTIVAGAAAMLVVVSGTGYFALGGIRQGVGPQAQAGQAQEGPVAGCSVDILDAPAGGSAEATAVDPTGRTIVGTVRTAAGQSNAVRFEGGRAVPYAGAAGTVVAINANGLLIGYDDVDQASHMLGWTYHNGKKSMLAKLDGYDYVFPTAVNSRGDVVGAAMGDANDDTVPVLWPADKPGTVRTLAMPAGFGTPNTGGSQAVGVAEDGTVVGVARGAPIRWTPDGTPSALPTPAGDRYGAPSALRGHYAYGSVNANDENRNVAVRWDLGSGVMKVLEGAPYDVADGTPGGWSITMGGDYREPTRITPDGTVEKLPLPRGMLPAPKGTGVIAHSISDDGATITGATWGDQRRPVIWHC